MPLRFLLMSHVYVQVFAELERRHGRFARVKEILESAETFLHAEQAILRTDPTTVLKRGKVRPEPSDRPRTYNPTVSRVVDVACGHGLVGLLLAYRFPSIQVVGIDRVQRPAYAAYVDAWQAAHAAHSDIAHGGAALSSGVAHADVVADGGRGDAPSSDAASTDETNVGTPLGNIRFIEGDFTDSAVVGDVAAQADGAQVGDALAGDALTGGALVDEHTLVLCVHGCNEVNVEAVQMAKRARAGWLILPCCLRAELYLQADSMRLPDDTRYAFLCGSMATSYGAERVATLDARVTPRSILLSAEAGGSGEARARVEAARQLTARGRVDELPSVRLRNSRGQSV